MRNLILIAICMMMLSQAGQASAQNHIRAGTFLQTIEVSEEIYLVGTLFLSHQGQLQIRWKGISVNGGQATLPITGDDLLNARFPTLTFNLQTLLGKNWMETVQLHVSSSQYDRDPARGTTDIQIGTITLALTQKLAESEGWSWTISESVGNTVKLKRIFHDTGKVSATNPLSISVNTRVVRRFSKNLAVGVAVGAYVRLMEPQEKSESPVLNGGYGEVTLNMGDRFSLGTRLERSRRIVPGADSSTLKTIDATVTAQYFLKRNERFQHSLQAQYGTFNNGIVKTKDGSNRVGRRVSVGYTLGW